MAGVPGKRSSSRGCHGVSTRPRVLWLASPSAPHIHRKHVLRFPAFFLPLHHFWAKLQPVTAYMIPSLLAGPSHPSSTLAAEAQVLNPRTGCSTPLLKPSRAQYRATVKPARLAGIHHLLPGPLSAQAFSHPVLWPHPTPLQSPNVPGCSTLLYLSLPLLASLNAHARVSLNNTRLSSSSKAA